MRTSNFDEEYWLPMPGYDHYIVSTYGHARKIRSDFESVYSESSFSKNLPITEDSDGDDAWRLYDARHSAKLVKIANAVAITFIHMPGLHVHVSHIDGNKHNNAVWNLEWVLDDDSMARIVAKKAIEHVKEDLKNEAITEEVKQFVKNTVDAFSEMKQKLENVAVDDEIQTSEHPDVIIASPRTDADHVENISAEPVEKPKKKTSGKYRVYRVSDNKEYSSISRLSSEEGLPYEKLRDALNSTGEYTDNDGNTYKKEESI